MESHFERYLSLLLKWNKTYNLTAITLPKEIEIKHFEDSLAPLPFLPRPCRLLDLGCGAGFPGIPLKLKRPDLEVVLLDSNRKKIAFCETVIRELKLNSILTYPGRAESQKTIGDLGLFDVVTSRATLSLKEFLSLALHFLAPGALAIAMKSRGWQKEYQKNRDWELKEVFDYVLSEKMGERSLLLLQRT